MARVVHPAWWIVVLGSAGCPAPTFVPPPTTSTPGPRATVACLTLPLGPVQFEAHRGETDEQLVRVDNACARTLFAEISVDAVFRVGVQDATTARARPLRPGLNWVSVRYAPRSVGSDTGQLTIADDLGGQIALDLQGTALGPQLALPPGTTFDPVPVGCDGCGFIRVLNAGTDVLTVSDLWIETTAGSREAFFLDDPRDLPLELDAMHGVDLRLRYRPITAGYGTLWVQSDDPSLPEASVSLTVYGITRPTTYESFPTPEAPTLPDELARVELSDEPVPETIHVTWDGAPDESFSVSGATLTWPPDRGVLEVDRIGVSYVPLVDCD